MIHLRVVSPPGVTAKLLSALKADPAVLNLTMLPVAHHPDGDGVQFDVHRGAGNRVLRQLRALELDQQGSIVLENVDASISATADRAKAGLVQFQELSPIWEEVDYSIRSAGVFPPSWFALIIIAGLIAAIGILTNSQILIVGAMVVGPEYAAIASFAHGVDRRERRSAATLTLGFAFAVLSTLLFAALVRWATLESSAYSLGERPIPNLIGPPDVFSLVVATLAGIVGVIALTESRVSALIGVFISATTIPAAADIGVSLAFGHGREAWGSILQLLLNLTVLSVVAIVGLPIQRAIWSRRARRSQANSEDLEANQ
jgi:uncharacterized hydrophobic protein (TIGR00271 family)